MRAELSKLVSIDPVYDIQYIVKEAHKIGQIFLCTLHCTARKLLLKYLK